MATADTATIIAGQQAAATLTLAQADGFLANLLNTTNVAFGNPFNIDDLIPAAYNYASVPQVYVPIVTGGTRPDLTHLDTVGAPQSPNLAFTALTPIALPADDLTTPTSVFSFAEGVYDRTLLDPWRAKLLLDLTTGSYGIDTNDEIALLNRTRDREVEAALTRVEGASREFAARGFPLPPGELAIQMDRAYQDMQNKVADANRDIYVKRANQFVEARKFTITEVREMERILLQHYNSMQERAFNVSRATVEFSIAIFNALIAKYKARLDAAIATGQIQFERARAETEQMRGYVELYRGQVSAYEANLRRVLDTARVQVEAYGIDVQSNKVLNDGQVAVATLQAKVIEATVQQNIQISGVAIENAKSKLLATVEALKFRADSSKYAAEKFYALLTGIEGTINSLAAQTSTA